MRALEKRVEGWESGAGAGSTRIFIYPGYGSRSVVPVHELSYTRIHPVMLVSAFAARS